MEIAPNLRLPGDARIKITQSLVFYYLLNSEPTMAHYSCSSDGWLAVCGKHTSFSHHLSIRASGGMPPIRALALPYIFVRPPDGGPRDIGSFGSRSNTLL